MGKKKSSLVIFTLPFCIVGIVFVLCAGIWGKITYDFAQNAEPVVGIISEITRERDSDGDISHTVYVNYDFGGKRYKNIRIGTYSSSMYEGAEIELLCDPTRPTNVRSESLLYIGPIIFAVLGVIMSAIGIVPMVCAVRKNAAKRKLLEKGYVLHAKVEAVEKNRSVRVNRTYPYVIYCSYQDPFSGMIYRFRSDNLWSNPSEIFCEGSPIDVYVNENDYSKYYVAAEEVLLQRIIDFT